MRNVAISSVRPDEEWTARRARLGPQTEGIHPPAGSPYRSDFSEKMCLVYCGDGMCNCRRGQLARTGQLTTGLEPLGSLLSDNPQMYAIYRLNTLRVRAGGSPTLTPNYAEKLRPGETLCIEGRRTSRGVTTYWPLGSLAGDEAAACAQFGRVFQTLTLRSLWSEMDTAPRNGTHIRVWTGDEELVVYRGDGLKRPEAWISVDDGCEIAEEALAWRGL